MRLFDVWPVAKLDYREPLFVKALPATWLFDNMYFPFIPQVEIVNISLEDILWIFSTFTEVRQRVWQLYGKRFIQVIREPNHCSVSCSIALLIVSSNRLMDVDVG